MVEEVEIIEELIKAGGKIEQVDEFGMTAIDYASRELGKIKNVSEHAKGAMLTLSLEEEEKKFDETRKKLALVKKELKDINR